ncbi:MAG: hypothetical protein M3Z29_00480 [Pseudomonadota bacterium]|nr:hypothetical protein [Pseudomonadota bacterium]
MNQTHAFRPALTVLCFALTACLVAPAAAQTAPAAKTAKTAKAAPAKTAKKAVVELAVPDAGPDQVKAAEMVYVGRYDCEFSQSLDIHQSLKHSAYVEVKSGKSGWLMKPVLSSTGAIRLEDVKGETLMVQIASKSMLLNVKTGHRIVDDCVSPKQRELIEAARAAKAGEAGTARSASAASAAS